jgi:KDO2-lipid IV(A) lauroyltransferase
MTPRAGPALRLRWRVEAAASWLWLAALGQLSPEAASNLGGWLGRRLGPLLPAQRVARQNLALALPELDRVGQDRVLRGMWDNLGRIAGEYPHLAAIVDPDAGRLEFVGRERVRDMETGRSGGIAWSGHLANFEVMAVAAAQMAGNGCATVVRSPNNPYAAAQLERRRAVAGGVRVPKGRDAGRLLLKTLRARGVVAILLDQRLSDGIPAPFFGREAMTPPAAAMMAIRLQVPLVPVRLERLGPARFRMTFEPPMALPSDGGMHDRILALTTACNRRLESWVRAKPEDWLWAHRRWKRKAPRPRRLKRGRDSADT